jgi:hypothetical protein
VKLTDEELVLAEKWISRLDKDARARRGYRWSHLALTVLAVCLAGFLLWFSRTRFHNWWGDGGLYPGNLVPPESVQFECKMQSIGMAVVLCSFGMAMVFIFVSASMIVQTVRAWRTWPRDLLIAKLLRAKLDEEKALLASPPAGAEGSGEG